MPDNTCISCGRMIPEGRQICLHCGEYDDMQDFGGLPRTNGDRIRSMTDGELAQWIATIERRALFTDSTTSETKWWEWLESEVQPDKTNIR